MLTYSLASSAARHARFDATSPKLNDPHGRQDQRSRQADRRFDGGGLSSNSPVGQVLNCKLGDASGQALDIIPAHVVSRRAITWDGVTVEIVQSLTRDKVEFRYRAPCHLLVAYEEGFRDDGETLVDDLPRSTLRTLGRRLTFVPAGHEFREWQRPRVRTRVICLYIDPAKIPIHPGKGVKAGTFRAQVLFENSLLWENAVKLASAIEGGPEEDRYAEALGIVIAHELLRVQANVRRDRTPARGGLAVWQQRIVATYIEEHLAESVPLATLARLVQLSTYYFCRAFKRSFQVSPHRFHINRRIERAKMLLATPNQSVTDIALALGFSETSSFSAAFRQTTGATPTEYRRAM
jgi:AraC family transcriptional regulator